MLRACPHHGFSELTQIDTFYNGLNEQDKDSLNVTAGGNLLSKTTREALKIIENKSKVRYSRSKSNVSRMNTNSRDSSSKTDDRIDKLVDQISNLVEIVNIKRYIDTKPNHELIHHCLKNPPYKFTWADKEVPISEGIDNDIYSTVDACPNACEIWKAIKRNQYDVTNHQVNVQFLLQLQTEWQRSQQAATKNKGKEIVNSPQPIYDQEPSMVTEDDETSKDKEIDKVMALISLSFKKIYKPTNNNLRTSSNTSRANQDNSPRINRSTGYENQRIGNVTGARETVEDQELEAHYIYMAKLQEVSPDAADSGPIFDTEPGQKVSNNDHYNVFAIESEHLEQSEYVRDTYLIEQDEHNPPLDAASLEKVVAFAEPLPSIIVSFVYSDNININIKILELPSGIAVGNEVLVRNFGSYAPPPLDAALLEKVAAFAEPLPSIIVSFVYSDWWS
nr:reverse transcriptase domain-containing protein [Tanacetum cinerariifolium]